MIRFLKVGKASSHSLLKGAAWAARGSGLEVRIDLWIRSFAHQSVTDSDLSISLIFPPERFSFFLVETIGSIVRSVEDFVFAIDCGDYFVVFEHSWHSGLVVRFLKDGKTISHSLLKGAAWAARVSG
jgi:hypothetical protein